MTLVADIAALLVREIETLRRTIAAYPDTQTLWARPPGTPNSAGTLALHLAGNLRHYVGAVLGGTGYVRDRPAEFATRDLPAAALDAQLADTVAVIQRILPTIDARQLDAEFPEAVGGHRVRTQAFLVHLLSHCAYHVGQADYHRRLVTGDPHGVQALASAGIPGATRVG